MAVRQRCSRQQAGRVGGGGAGREQQPFDCSQQRVGGECTLPLHSPTGRRERACHVSRMDGSTSGPELPVTGQWMR